MGACTGTPARMATPGNAQASAKLKPCTHIYINLKRRLESSDVDMLMGEVSET